MSYTPYMILDAEQFDKAILKFSDELDTYRNNKQNFYNKRQALIDAEIKKIKDIARGIQATVEDYKVKNLAEANVKATKEWKEIKEHEPNYLFDSVGYLEESKFKNKKIYGLEKDYYFMREALIKFCTDNKIDYGLIGC